MRVVIQRVSKAAVIGESGERRTVGKGLLILLGIETRDDQSDVEFLVGKISRLRIFDDPDGVMNLSLTDVSGEVLVISQFTLHAETKKGNRPSYIRSARPEQAVPLYNKFIDDLKSLTLLRIEEGWFGDHMEVELTNDGPVTIIIDSRQRE